MTPRPDRSFTCLSCGKWFESKATNVNFCSRACRNKMRRERYVEDPGYRKARIEAAKKWAGTPRGQQKIVAARERRRRERELPWYHLRQVELPPWAQAFRREFWKQAQRRHREKGDYDKRVIAAFENLRRLSLQDLQEAGSLKNALGRVRPPTEGGEVT